jgi:uncharacterized membrane protein
MTTFDLIVRVIHVVSASIWIGAAFFAAWFLMPAIRDTGPDGGKVMMAVQKRGWVAAVPIIATLTVLSGFWLYRAYMGAEGNAAMILGAGGVVALLAYVCGAGVVSPSIAKANKLAQQAAGMADGPAKAAADSGQWAVSALTFARIVSLLVIPGGNVVIPPSRRNQAKEEVRS